jgi:hypothetical protein
MQNITEPLRLAVGSHKKGSGKGCAMNVVSWESGDSTITDLPACADTFLAKVVQRVNDKICVHRDGSDLLCPECSLTVLDLGHRTVGTSAHGLSPAQIARVYVTIAVEEAESVLGLTTDERPRQACALVRRFLAGEAVTGEEWHNVAYAANAAAAYAATNAAYAANAAAAYAATNAAYAAYATNAAYAAYAAYAANAAASYAAANAANVANDGLACAHRIIDRFEELTGIKAAPVPVEVTAQAVAAMRTAS